MSLIKQLWLAIILVTAIALGGSVLVSTLSARHYLEQQLAVKNIDNATSLALVLSQLPKDPVTIELQVTAQFDTGHYRRIRLADPSGQTIVERHFDGSVTEAPPWFMELVTIGVQPGIAQVQDGWKQFGTLTVESHSRYAYASLWQAARQLLAWFLAAAVLCGIVGTLVLKWITRPLNRMVEQAEAIGDRRFITTPEPNTQEFRSVVRAMNALSERVRAMLAEESRRLETLRHQVQHDELTGLFNREQFMRHLSAALARDDSQAGGVLVIARVPGLIELNQRLGRLNTDRYLCAVAEALQAATADNGGWLCARLGGSDFGLLAPAADTAEAVATAVHAHLAAAKGAHPDIAPVLVAAGEYAPGEERPVVLSRIDGALAASEETGEPNPALVGASGKPLLRDSQEGWQQAIATALAGDGLELMRYPVRTTGGELLHHEAPLRMRVDGEWQRAGLVLPWAARLGLMADVDLHVLQLALKQLAAYPGLELAINVSADALRDGAARDRLYASIAAARELAPRLWIEVQEHSALQHQPEFRALCLMLQPLGCRLGLKHAGAELHGIEDLHELGLHHIKIDPTFIADIDASPGNQAFVRGLSTIAHSIGLLSIAEGVGRAEEVATLERLGVDGMTGPAVR